ncbi:MAG: ketol-acid reductoisomerase [Fimbriimonadaceae bacterium]|nr:ketol-acid reductoisomerase [Fimbriimonadaceae bacterium]
MISELRVTVLGYGNQGRAHALNLRESGVRVTVGARQGKGFELAVEDGFEPTGLGEAVREANLVALCLPDEVMGALWKSVIEPNLAEDAAVLFAHGFCIVFGQIVPGDSHPVLLVSPVGPGTAVRERFGLGGVPAFVSSREPGDLELAHEYAAAIGCERRIETTFLAETVCDLFGEQTVLCGGMPWLARAAWETLVEAGYPAEVAYLECVAQVRLLAELMEKRGIAGMLEAVSGTAEFGAYEAGPDLVDEHVRSRLRQRLQRIESGEFAQDWLQDASSGATKLLRQRLEAASHPVEQARHTG